MAVYKRRYTGYEGPLTPTWSRFLIVLRSSTARLFRSKFLMIYLALCFFYPVVCVIRIYLSHNPSFVLILRLLPQMLAINEEFFYSFCAFQGRLALLLTAFVSPSLVSWDLADGALPLYFCRPFTRFEYVLGKLSVLAPLLSAITWIPGLALYALEASLNDDWTWGKDHLFVAGGIFAGFLVWILILSLIGLALSACVKWRVAAGALILGVFFGGAGFGAAINSSMGVTSGSILDLSEVMHTVWAMMLHYDLATEMSPTAAWIALGVVSAVCVWLLQKRIRTFEVIR